jgi:DNA-binding beta-propeller fold protein YncE
MKRTSIASIALLVVLGAAFAATPAASAVTPVATIDALIGEDPQAIAISSDGSTAIVGSDGSIQIIDTATNAVTSTIPNDTFDYEGVRFIQWVNVPGTTSYLGNTGAGIVLLDPADVSNWSAFDMIYLDTVVSSIAVSADGQSVWAIVVEGQQTGYVLAQWDISAGYLIGAWDLTSWTSIDDNGPQLVVSPDGSTAYALFAGAFDDSELLMFDLATQSVSDSISIDDDVTSMAMSPDGQYIFVTSSWNDTVLAYGADGTSLGTVASVHDANQVTFTPDSNFAYVTSPSHVHMLSVQSLTEVERFEAGESPFGIAVTPNGTNLYVTNNFDDGTVTVVGIPAITPASQQISGTVGQALSSAALTASGFSGPTQFSLAGGQTLPAGLALDTSTGQISGTPTVSSAAETFSIYATETGGDEFAVASVQIAVDPDPTLTPSTQTLTAVVSKSFQSEALSAAGFTATPSFSIAPALPTGLSLNTTTGVVSGTPATATNATTYTITASAAGSSATSTLSLRVAPKLSPSHQVVESFTGVAISTETIESEGLSAPVTFSVTPALPTGLTFDTATGRVSGSVTTAIRDLFTITASGGGVTGEASLILNIIPTLSVHPADVSVAAGSPVDKPLFIPSGFPGAVTYSSVPALPAGLTLTPDGHLVGTASIATSPSIYTVTAAGGGWRASTVLGLSVSAVLSPSGRSVQAGAGQSIDLAGPVPVGFPSTVSYSVSPVLPEGVHLDPATGRVVGTPAQGQGPRMYTVTGSGGGFSATSTLTMTVAALDPATQEVSGRAGSRLASAPLIAKWFGGHVTYSVSPALPSWLTLDADSGVISGTPTAAFSRTGYVVTATDGVTRTDARVVIRVAAAPKPAPSPAPSPAPNPASSPVATPDSTPASEPDVATSSEPSPAASQTLSRSPSPEASATDDASANDPLPWVIAAVIGLLVLAGAAIAGTMMIVGRRNAP